MIKTFDINFYLDSIFFKEPKHLIFLDLRNLDAIADFFIICHKKSNRQVSAMANYVKSDLKKNNIRIINFEGINEGNWAILDYGRVVIHIFKDTFREFYNLEGFWFNAKIYKIKKKDNNSAQYIYEDFDLLESKSIK